MFRILGDSFEILRDLKGILGSFESFPEPFEILYQFRGDSHRIFVIL